MTQKIYTFTLDEAQTKKLLSILELYEDCGPRGYAWTSSELDDLKETITLQKWTQNPESSEGDSE